MSEINIDILDTPVEIDVINTPGVGVPTGGTIGQYLKKVSAIDYDTAWDTLPTYVSSVGLSMPSAFTVSNSPITSSGTLTVVGAGTTLDYVRGDGSLAAFPLTLPVLQDVRNQTGSTLTAGTVVYISGATGNLPTVSKAIATGDATSAQTLGMVSADIANNGTGKVVVIGTCSGLDTSALSEGQQLYLSPTVAGGYTTTKPYAPDHLVYVGIVTRSHPTLGTIEVRVQNGYELDEIHDVAARNPLNNDGIFYNSTTQLWEKKSIATVLGYTPVSGTGASGQVSFWNGTTSQTGSNNLFWDSANGRLGINTSFPNTAIGVSGNISVQNSNGLTTYSRFGVVNVGTDNSTFIGSITNNNFLLYAANVERARITNTGNFHIGTFVSDSGQRLQVTGDTLLKGSGNTSATVALTVQNSDGLNSLRVLNNTLVWIYSNLRLGNTTSGPLIFPISTIGTSGDINGTNLSFYSNTTTQAAPFGRFFFGGDVMTQTSGTTFNLYSQNSFSPTSGTATSANLYIRSNINQTGGANGVTRGILIQPALTAAADWRSIEWDNNTGWGLYGAGTSNNYLGGRLAIGSTNFGSSVLAIRANLTGTTSQAGVLQSGTVLSDVTSTVRGFLNQLNTQASAFSLFEYYHFDATQGTIGASSTVSNQYGFRAADSLTGATNNFGFYGNIPSGTGRWNLYMNGTADNYLAGKLGVGSTTLTTANLRVALNLGTASSTSLQYGVVSDGTIQSTVTVLASNYLSTTRTQASAFTIPYVAGYYASQGTFGAGSVVTEQMGFWADNTLIGAANNYGFYGNIASGTGRWNFYAAGTAPNYIAGNLLIGSTNNFASVYVQRNAASGGDQRIFQSQLFVGGAVVGRLTAFDSGIANLNTANVANMVHFNANQGALTNSTITNQFGFQAENLVGATNNYGFYSNITSGTGRWNFFAVGSALNYMNGGLILGASTTSTGELFQVQGGARVTGASTFLNNMTINGAGNTSSTFALNIQNSDLTSLYRFRNDGSLLIGNLSTGASMHPYGTNFLPDLASRSVVFYSNITTQGTNGAFAISGLDITASSSNSTTVFLIAKNFTPTGGSATYFAQSIAPTINQQGGANGVTRGLYINPTITSAADWRTLEWTNNSGWGLYGAGTCSNYLGGNTAIGSTANTTDWLNIAASTTAKAQIYLASGTAPTAPSNGDIWFDGTDLKMRIGGVTKTFTLV